jgi:hypothetical protein
MEIVINPCVAHGSWTKRCGTESFSSRLARRSLWSLHHVIARVVGEQGEGRAGAREVDGGGPAVTFFSHLGAEAEFVALSFDSDTLLCLLYSSI